MAYTLTQAELRELRRRATNVEKRMETARKGDAVARRAAAEDAIREAEHAMEVFAEKGYPDCWQRWQRMYQDAGFMVGLSW